MLDFARPLADAHALPAATLAWVGDAVYELHVRADLLSESHNARTLSKRAVERVNHQAQSALLARLAPHLNDTEAGVVARGRNHRGSVPRNGDVQAYRRATGLEALVGYLYLSGQDDRLAWVLAQYKEDNDE